LQIGIVFRKAMSIQPRFLSDQILSGDAVLSTERYDLENLDHTTIHASVMLFLSGTENKRDDGITKNEIL